ncbi:Spx/MgsR family RNA polymerase-binding regulatory protein [Puniceicoccaceae bacterium K14]|nr:Spx/MgsR family RNA polymerase-binding regulatory protein [Puniceicoccaceae bacterium K14]
MYSYQGCGSCRKATKWFDSKKVVVSEVPIRETPPTKDELSFMIDQYSGELRKVFNVSGQDYRSLGLKDKMSEMTKAEAIELLSSNGNLIKRPFVLWGNRGSVGFKEDVWEELLASG